VGFMATPFTIVYKMAMWRQEQAEA
jgi:hypothetical protein